MSAFRPGRFLGITAGTLVILALGIYGPATLLGPLPPVSARIVAPDAGADAASPPAMPASGVSALVSVREGTGGPPEVAPLATGGAAEPVPMASAAKLVTALVVLDAKPLPADAAGPSVPVTPADYRDYIDYSKAGARAVTVFPDESWTQREMLQALLLGSSNNHADQLARWAFGSVESYVSAANSWLAANEMTSTRVADATGLDEASAGTASDLARLAALAATNPVITGILADPASALASRRGVENTTEYHADEGITGISRSYTDAAGVCFLFTAEFGTPEKPYRIAGAFLREPDYDTLGADVTALAGSARAGIADRPLLRKGDRYAEFSTSWGDTASAVVRVSKTRVTWLSPDAGEATVSLDEFATGRAGATIGRVSVPSPDGPVSAPLVLDQPITDPGPGWRLLNPVPVITALIESR